MMGANQPPLSRKSRSNSRAMTVKEANNQQNHGERDPSQKNGRSLSLNSMSADGMSERSNNTRGDHHYAQSRRYHAQGRSYHQNRVPQHLRHQQHTERNSLLKSPADMQRIKGVNVVLTPMGNEGHNISGRHGGQMHSIFRDSAPQI